MAFNQVREDGIPKGKIVPLYLTEDGNLHPIYFRSEEELELVETMIGIAMEHKIVVDTNTYINNPEEKLTIYNFKENKKIL